MGFLPLDRMIHAKYLVPGIQSALMPYVLGESESPRSMLGSERVPTKTQLPLGPWPPPTQLHCGGRPADASSHGWLPPVPPPAALRPPPLPAPSILPARLGALFPEDSQTCSDLLLGARGSGDSALCSSCAQDQPHNPPSLPKAHPL